MGIDDSFREFPPSDASLIGDERRPVEQEQEPGCLDEGF
jgi:hypothetical protein